MRRDVEVASSARSPLQTDLLLLRGKVLLHIGLRALEDDLALGLVSLHWGRSVNGGRKPNEIKGGRISPERWYVSGSTVKTKLPLAKSYSMHHKSIKTKVYERNGTWTYLARRSGGGQSLLTGLFVLLALLEESLRDFDVLYE